MFNFFVLGKYINNSGLSSFCNERKFVSFFFFIFSNLKKTTCCLLKECASKASQFMFGLIVGGEVCRQLNGKFVKFRTANNVGKGELLKIVGGIKTPTKKNSSILLKTVGNERLMLKVN